MNHEMNVKAPSGLTGTGGLEEAHSVNSSGQAVMSPGVGSWIFTFGFDHPFARRYVRLYGPEESARAFMTAVFGQGKWAGCYPEGSQTATRVTTRLRELDLGVTLR